MRRARRRQAGLTLVELLISMGLVGLLIGLVFTLFLQTATALRFQVEVGGLQQALIGAQTAIGRDVRQAGLHLPNGYRTAYDGGLHHPPLDVVNDPDAPDELGAAFADPALQARVMAISLGTDTVVVDDATGIAGGALIVLTDPRPLAAGAAGPQTYDACVVQIEAVDGNRLTLSTAAPWGQVGNGHCGDVAAANGGAEPDTMLFGFVTRAYRIDPSRPELGVLQRSATGGVEDDWEDLGIGFTDLQVATRWYEPADVVDLDGDGDPERDWYSGSDQDGLTAPAALAPTWEPIEMTVSVVLRTGRDLSGVVSARTPSLTDEDNPYYNPIGDRAAVELEGVPDGDRPEALRGDRVYRWATMRFDLRNAGVSR